MVVVGGGLTGLVAAERLSAAGREVVVFEREKQPGGACRTIENGVYFLNTPGHSLPVARPEPEAFLESPPDTDELLREVHRLAGQEKPA